MDWYVVDKKYINYLTQFDSRVGYVEYGERLKLHVGILLTIGDFHYYVPISSAKPKHQKMSNSLDFHKLQDESTGYLYAVLNINNMIPVPDNCLTQLKYNQVESFRSFSNEKERIDYIYLLQKEKALIDNVQDSLQNKAMKLYQKCIAKHLIFTHKIMITRAKNYIFRYKFSCKIPIQINNKFFCLGETLWLSK